jgi:hypothetical protein
VGFAFAPAERDVYSHDGTHKCFRSVRSETRQWTTAEQSNAIALLRSEGLKKESAGYKHLAPQGRSDEGRSVALQN